MALCFTGAGIAKGQVVYTDLNPDVTITTVPDSVAIDFNNDAVNDYVIKRFNWGGNTANPAVIMPPAMNNAIMGTMGAVLPYVSALTAGTTIDGAATTWIVYDGSDTQVLKFGLASTYSGGTYGNFNDGVDHFIGCKFMIGSNTHYGWVRVQCVSGGSSATIKDYAYQSTPATAITAGQGAGINNTATIESNIYAFNKMVNVNLKNETTGSIKIYNAMGELVTNQAIDGTNNRIDMQSHANGVYMIVVETSNGSITKKVNIL